jgi:hypothetical protein
VLRNEPDSEVTSRDDGGIGLVVTGETAVAYQGAGVKKV